jgi:KUP system potassium uptake protein
MLPHHIPSTTTRLLVLTGSVVKNSLPIAPRLRTGLTVAALGVVYGDIGTSPLYTLKTCFTSAHVGVTPETVLGILSLIVWALIVVVCVKYVGIVMRVNHDGEGGILALLALLLARPDRGISPKATWFVVVVVVGAAMLFGDGVITPAISVISAVEGLGVATTAAQPWIVPISLGMILALFWIQRRGTEKVGGLFGPVMLLWFLSIAAAGIGGIVRRPGILWAVDPRHAVAFATHHGLGGFFVLGGVVLAVTGVEALYADLSHFGRKPIAIAWYGLVWPSVTLSYLGQGARLLTDPHAFENPFYALVSGPLLLPMVALATAATIIASQALISGAFTLTEQAIALQLCPRMEIVHTSNRYPGQVFVPAINLTLGIACALLIVAFRSSDRLAAAYGLAVAVTMAATSVAFYLVVSRVRHWNPAVALLTLICFLLVDVSFVIAGLPKFLDGGYVPFAISAVLATIALTWLEGRRCIAITLHEQMQPVADYLAETRDLALPVVNGSMVFLTGDPNGVPFMLKHRWLKRRAFHERIVLLNLSRVQGPYARAEERVTIEHLSDRLVRVVAHFGYMEPPRISPILSSCSAGGLHIEDPETSFFYADPKLVPAAHGMPRSLRWLFGVLARNSRPLPDDLQIPADRRVEIGLEVGI